MASYKYLGNVWDGDKIAELKVELNGGQSNGYYNFLDDQTANLFCPVDEPDRAFFIPKKAINTDSTGTVSDAGFLWGSQSGKTYDCYYQINGDEITVLSWKASNPTDKGLPIRIEPEQTDPDQNPSQPWIDFFSARSKTANAGAYQRYVDANGDVIDKTIASAEASYSSFLWSLFIDLGEEIEKFAIAKATRGSETYYLLNITMTFPLKKKGYINVTTLDAALELQ